MVNKSVTLPLSPLEHPAALRLVFPMRPDFSMRLILLTTVTMAAFAANSVLNRVAIGSGSIDPIGFALIRVASGAAMLSLLLGLRRFVRDSAVWPGWRGRFGGVVGLLIYLIGFSAAYTHLTAGAGALILFGCVQITMFAGALWTGEQVRPRRWFGVCLAFGGLAVLAAPQVQAAGAGAVGAMAAAGIGWGIYSLEGRKSADALAATGWNFLLALPLATAVWLLSKSGVPQMAMPGIGLAVLSGAVTSGLGYALWYQLLPQLGAARAAVAQLTVPVIAAAGGFALIGEGISLRFVLASVVVLGGVAVASI